MVTITRNGTAYLPLHYGKPPELLYRKIVRLTGQICELISETYGTQELIWRMGDPVWFHSLSLVLDYKGNYSVIQQGLNYEEKMARRYHWSSKHIMEKMEESRMGIRTDILSDNCLDLSSPLSRKSRDSMLKAIKEKPVTRLNE